MCAASLRGEVSTYSPPPHPPPPHPPSPHPPSPSSPVPSSPVPTALLLQLRGISGGRLLARPCAWPEVLTRACDGRYRHARLRSVPLWNSALPANAGRGVRGRQSPHGRLVEIDCEIARDRAGGGAGGRHVQLGVSGRARDGARWQSAALSSRSTHPYVHRAFLGRRSPS